MEDLRPHYTNPVDHITRKDCERLISLALEEDAPNGDVTSEAIFDSEAQGRAQIIAKQKGLICGLSLIPVLLEIDHERGYPSLSLHSHYRDGQEIEIGDVIAHLSGNLLSLLRLERVVLNFLQYLSGISSQTAQAVQHVGQKVFILDTRKTLPGFRRLSKYAVYCGGGTNHRIHLSDMAMIKDNHLNACQDIKTAIEAVRQRSPNIGIEIEIASLEQLNKLLELNIKVDVILLDNMTIAQAQEAKTRIKNHFTKQVQNNRPFVELSGNWTLKKLSTWKEMTSTKEMDSKLGISLGSLTHSSVSLDLSMEISPK